MLWSLLKILIFVTLVAALTFGATLLMETGEQVRISLASTEFTLSPVAAVVLSLVLLGAAYLLFKLAGLLLATLKFLNGDETAISRYFMRNRERKGFEALAQGMMALASCEGRVAMAKAARAERYLGRPDLTQLLTAQAAELSGDRAKATETYKKMLTDERTKFVGVRGLLHQKLSEGDTETAMALAEKAFALKPRNGEVQDTLLRLQAGDENWAGARKTLAAKLKSGDLPRDVHKRRDAVLAYSEAADAVEAGKMDKAEAHANEANRLAPGLVPSAALAARMAIRAGKQRQATKLLRKAWELNPHPELAAAYAEIVPDETAAARIKRFEALVKPNPNHDESRLLMAELFIAAEDFPAARKAMGDLYETKPNARSLTIMAAVERGEGSDDAIVRAWLAKAVTASRGPQWTCENCNNIHASWTPVCGNCGAFDSLSWVEPPESEIALTNSAEMLPLIVGAIADQSAKKDPEEEVIVPDVVDITPTETGDDNVSKEDEAPAQKSA
ncbi:heme biosynthesis HemY N-terminal domain-containing protein [Dinoroseobacter sp. PD6]|uniref:heme biosynthesis protein HemY n=1 Tax=Dinoroseobacter sp. PD6 TaxID=3028384 RepID=UPI00237A6710|nr:heme biosynthesis HemY N-terminal domain-containing protein [Dinoroseobacter sp. PD6]MDD9718130.1 heme biosynthesis HemY N-terminal domain-containing protein [Dinoroseobacter sp. PD6]